MSLWGKITHCTVSFCYESQLFIPIIWFVATQLTKHHVDISITYVFIRDNDRQFKLKQTTCLKAYLWKICVIKGSFILKLG